MSNKVDEIINAVKLGEILNRNEVAKKKNSKSITLMIVLGVVAIVAIIAFTVYKILTPDYLDEFDDDFDDDFDFGDADDFDVAFDNDYASDDED